MTKRDKPAIVEEPSNPIDVAERDLAASRAALAELEQADALTQARAKVAADEQRVADARSARSAAFAAAQRAEELAERCKLADEAQVLAGRVAQHLKDIDDAEESALVSTIDLFADLMALAAVGFTLPNYEMLLLNMASSTKWNFKQLNNSTYAASPTLGGLHRQLFLRLVALDEVPSGERMSHVDIWARMLAPLLEWQIAALRGDTEQMNSEAA
jgi:hypothetical protein